MESFFKKKIKIFLLFFFLSFFFFFFTSRETKVSVLFNPTILFLFEGSQAIALIVE